MKKLVISVVLVLLIVLSSCRSTEVVAVDPEKPDLAPSMQMLFDARPDNEQLHIVTDIQTLDDVVMNSAEYLKAWQLWESYAMSLEEYIRALSMILS